MAFFDLWRRGFFLTDGSKFGADFLAYPGDPIRYHAQNIIICLESSTELERMKKSENARKHHRSGGGGGRRGSSSQGQQAGPPQQPKMTNEMYYMGEFYG